MKHSMGRPADLSLSLRLITVRSRVILLELDVHDGGVG